MSLSNILIVELKDQADMKNYLKRGGAQLLKKGNGRIHIVHW